MMRSAPRWTLLVCWVGLSACGEVKPGTDAGDERDGSTVDGAAGLDGSRPDASPPDASGPDAMVCTGEADCNNGMICDGEETCGVDGTCQPGIPPDCGETDVCFSRYCDPAAGGCGEDPLSHPIDYSFTGGPSGTVTLFCNDGATVHVIDQICPTGAPFQLRLTCAIDDSGRLQAVADSTNPNCLSGGAGPFVSSGCSVYGDAQTNFSCCWP